MIIVPSLRAAFPIGGAMRAEIAIPQSTVTRGVTRMSTLVSFETAFPSSDAIIATKKTARGPPAPPRALEAKPTAASENRTIGGQWRA